MKKRLSSGHEGGGEMVWETEDGSGAERRTKAWKGFYHVPRSASFAAFKTRIYTTSTSAPAILGDALSMAPNKHSLFRNVWQRMDTNHVDVFAKARPFPINFWQKFVAQSRRVGRPSVSIRSKHSIKTRSVLQVCDLFYDRSSAS
ncbi:hypothetical protein PM082_002395 [Marasmius tenuissimus]|nr:hypothetical protein PM082_002395 [Marasmius tenuissimus]